MKKAFLMVLVSACATSVAAAQIRPETGQQAGKLPPKPASKIDPGAAKLDGKHEPDDRSGLGRRSNLDGGIAATSAEKAYAAARMDEIDRLVLKAVPEIGRLSYPMATQIKGFYGSAPKANTILQYQYILFADLGTRGLCSIFTANINPAPEGGAEPWAQGPVGKPVPGASFVLAELVAPPNPSYEQILIVRDGETPYHQLTREEVRRWQIVEEEGANGEKLANRKQLLATTPYERFMAEAPARKKMRDDVRAALKGLRTPAEIDAQINEMDDAERAAAKQLKDQAKEDRQQNDSMSEAATLADKARASIARMSAAERKVPAWVTMTSDTGYAFAAPESANVSRVVRVNPGFWTMHRSRVEVRSIHLDFSARCPKEPPPPEVHRALWKLRQNIDWAALKKMVNTP
jgi:hypothetical protein